MDEPALTESAEQLDDVADGTHTRSSAGQSMRTCAQRGGQGMSRPEILPRLLLGGLRGPLASGHGGSASSAPTELSEAAANPGSDPRRVHGSTVLSEAVGVNLGCPWRPADAHACISVYTAQPTTGIRAELDCP